MGDEGEIWNAHKEMSRAKKQSNKNWSLGYLEGLGIKYETLNEFLGHYRVGDFNFWPATGKFYNPKTKEKGRGVKTLLKIIKNNAYDTKKQIKT